ncbi:Pyrophosphatase PpaX [Bacteroides vulgatus]|uniref:phosphoglycolate phosphatase n=4 Tax=Phocaeicola vulgatus TaxID=821 RepID=A0A6N2WPG1_PHOVU|nr:HAD-IA family hydrolase [Phocaeicola vulgatus]MCE9431922.1 HAD-IA family hydrolase [Phocaeicola vulgatus]
MKYTTYLFDFDYTLADSSRGIVICFRNVLERHGHTGISDEAIKRTIGKTLEDSFSILSGITTPETLAEYKKEYVKEADTYMTVNTFFFPETLTVLKTLKSQGAQIGIISTKFRFRIREMVDQHFPKDFFDIIIGGEDVKQAKPDPQGIKKALRQLHRRKSETLYIGDSTVDAETAQAAKVDFVGVLNGMTTREELMVYPHRQILDNLSLLPLIHKFTPYEPDKHFPEKFFYSSCFPQKIVAFYKLLHQKQIRGKHEIKENPTCCVCKNCGNTFQGNYCPHCGQNRHTPRFTIRNAFQNILSGFFNIDHGFSRNLIELLYRPGYMIRDYLKGKRVHYYKPFQTLFVLAALYIMGVQLIDPAAIKLSEKEMEEEPTIASLMDDIKYQQEQTSDSCTKYYLGQSITYADSAQWAQTHSLSESIQAQIDAKFSNQDPNELKKEISKQIKKELKQKIKAKNGEIDDWRGLMKEIGTTLARQDSLRMATLGREANKQDSTISEIRKNILANMAQQDNPYEDQDIWNDLSEAGSEMKNVFNEMTNNYFTENSFLSAVGNLMKSWIHGNKAFSILALLPLFTISTRLSFCRTSIGRRLNLTENFFAQVYIACQILWISLLILPFTGTAHLNDIFDLSYKAIFILFVWDYRQLFGLSWWKSFCRTIIMFWYCFLGLLLVCSIIIGIIVLIAYIIQWGK